MKKNIFRIDLQYCKNYICIAFFVWIGFVGIHCLIVAADLFRRAFGGKYMFMGEAFSIPSGVVLAALKEALRAHLIWLPLLGVVVAGPSVFLLSRGDEAKHTKLRWFLSGVGLYASLNLALVMVLPGLLAHTPFLERIPAVFGLLLVAVTLFGIWGWLLPGNPRGRACLALLLVGMLAVPNDVIRRWKLRYDSTNMDGTGKGLFFIMDATGFDVFRRVVVNSFPEYLPSLRRGFSHFGNTRKQYCLLISGDVEATSRAFVLPVVGEDRTAASPAIPPQNVRVLLDDGGTVNAVSIPDFPGEVITAKAGVRYALQAPWRFPVLCWLQDLLSTTETGNPTSSFDAFLRDGERALEQSDLVIIHTTYPQRSLFEWSELWQAGGIRWLGWSPAAIGRPGGPCSPEKVYQIKVERTLRKALPWVLTQCARRPGLSALITGDHGQSFHSAIRLGKEVHGHHGFFFEADTAWIPFLPLGNTRVGKPSHLYSWLDLHPYLWHGVPREGMHLEGTNQSLSAATTFILHPAESDRVDSYPTNILDVPTFVRNIEIHPERGLQLSSRLPGMGHQQSVVVALPPDRLTVKNPAPGSKVSQVDYFVGSHLVPEGNSGYLP